MWSSRSFWPGEEIHALVTAEGCCCSCDLFSFVSLVSLLVPLFFGFLHSLSLRISFCDRLSMFHNLMSCQLIFWRKSIVTHTTSKLCSLFLCSNNNSGVWNISCTNNMHVLWFRGTHVHGWLVLKSKWISSYIHYIRNCSLCGSSCAPSVGSSFRRSLHICYNSIWPQMVGGSLSWILWCLKSSSRVKNESLHFLHLYLSRLLCSFLRCLKLLDLCSKLLSAAFQLAMVLW